MTAREVADRLNVKPITVRVWLSRGLFPNAELKFVEPFGKIWMIPESDLKNFKKPQMGRPKKIKKR